MKKNKLSICIMSVLFILLSLFTTSCIFKSNRPGNNTTNNITNNIKNEITEEVIDYKNLSIEDIQTAVQTVAKRNEKAVIGITCKEEVTTTAGKTVEKNNSIGSGVIYKREKLTDGDHIITNYKYYVMTNRHVVLGDDTSKDTKYNIYAYLADADIEIKATVVGYDSKVDIALVTFEYNRYIDPVEIYDGELEKGSFAIAIGNPDGYDYYGSVTFGVISGPIRYISVDTDNDSINDFSSEYIQHDVAINPGNSGGGLFDIYGRLIGINTLKIVSEKIDNMGFAIPISVVKTIVCEYLETGKEIVRPRLGVYGSEIRSMSSYVIENDDDILDMPNIYESETPYGIYVNSITAGSTLDGFGIEKHDIILSVAGIKATRTHIINAKLGSLVDFHVGDKVEISYYDRSDDKIKTIEAVLKS